MQVSQSSEGWGPYAANHSPGGDPNSPRLSPGVPTSQSVGHFSGLEDALYGSARHFGHNPRIEAQAPNGVDLSFREVSVAVKSNAVMETVCRRKSRVLVRAAMGFFPKGHLHGIVALSEDSATALVDVLSGRIEPVEGSVWADGLPVRVALYRESVGVVRMLSWTVPQFTVEENLHFAGAMRRAGQSAAERQKRVEQLGFVLGLDLQAKVKRVSAGQRRRVDVAMEMMAAPPVLFVHNPLWGLDCHSRADFMGFLRQASSVFGTTVVMTLPKLELSAYDALHSLVILGSGGHAVYSGERAAMAGYFFSRSQQPLHRIPTLQQPRDVSPLPRDGAMDEGEATEQTRLLGGGRSDGPTRRSTAGTDMYDEDGSPIGRMPSLLTQRPETDPGDSPAPASVLAGPSTLPAGARGLAATVSTESASAQNLDGGECVMDHVQLWADAGATDRYAAAFFDSAEKQELDDRIDAAITAARRGVPSAWLSQPLVQPMMLFKFGRLMFVSLKQRAVTVDWYVGWGILTLGVAACLWLANLQSFDQEGMFNVRGIIFFMLALTLQINGTLVRSYSDEVDRFMHLKASGVAPTLVQLLVTVLSMAFTRIVYLTPVSIGVAIVMQKEDGIALSVLLAVTSWAHITLVFVIVLFVRTARYAVTVTASMDAAMLFFSGFLVNTASNPTKSFAGLSLVRYAYGASVQHMLRQANYTCDGTNNMTSYCYTTAEYLELEGFQGDTVNKAAVTLAAVGAIASGVALVRMWFL